MTKQQKTKKGKAQRKWDADGYADEVSDVKLDYSAANNNTSDSETDNVGRSSAVDAVDSSTWGNKSQGKFVLKDLGDEVHGMLAEAAAEKNAAAASANTKSGLLGSGVNALSGLFRNVVGGKTLTQEDLDKAMKGMEEHLLKKNVAREAAVRLCEGVEKELVGVKTGSFESKSMNPHHNYHSKVHTHPILTLQLSHRHQHQNPVRHGIIPYKDAHTFLFTRPPTLHRCHHQACSSNSTLPSSLRDFNRRCQRCRQIHQPLQNLLFPVTKQVQGSHCSW